MLDKPNNVQLFGIGCAVQSYIFINFQMQHFLSLQANFNWQKLRIEKWVHLKYVSMDPLTTKAILNLYQMFCVNCTWGKFEFYAVHDVFNLKVLK